MGGKVKIAYLCNGMDHCSDKIGCYRCAKPGMDACRHTFNPKYAVNLPVTKPSLYPERFHKLEPGLDPENPEEVWWEGDVAIP